MCFVFVFVALLEYAAVNYFFWGARAKKKKKKGDRISQGNGSRTHELHKDYSAPFNLASAPNGRVPTEDDRKVSLSYETII